MKKISLYIHIPFCDRKCLYCDFLSFSNGQNQVVQYIHALVEEIVGISEKIKDYVVDTIFIGGGTPSSINAKYIELIMKVIYDHCTLSEDPEITIETNPGTLTKDKLFIYKDSGINRISMGLQSTDNEMLKILGRIHDYETFLENYQLIREVGFGNVNVDLMFALPGQDEKQWLETIEKVIALEPEHISAYSLIVEEHTPFMALYEKEKLNLPGEEIDRKMFWEGHELMGSKGYIQYEISNYAKEGYGCRHNRIYWNMKPYIGLGLGASSFFENKRMSNEIDLQDYISYNGDREKVVVESDEMSNNSLKEEFMFLGLRQTKGIKETDFENLFNESIDVCYGDVLRDLECKTLIVRKNGWIYLTRRGSDVSNQVFVNFLL